MPNIEISNKFSDKLNTSQLREIFNLAELQLKWFNTYHPHISPPFSRLLRINHIKILDFINLDLMGKYTKEDIDNKIKRMYKAYYSLFEISSQRVIRKYNNRLDSHG